MLTCSLVDILRGDWLIDRRIPSVGTFTGNATFASVNSSLLTYREDGRLRLEAGDELEMHRGYLYEAVGDRLQVMFADGRPFLELHPRDNTLVSNTHVCGQDNYSATYALESPDRLTIAMSVHGPLKQMTITSVLTRRDRTQGS